MVEHQISDKDMKTLLRSQQGELDGVAMYAALSKVVEDPRAAETFCRLAKDEARHAAVFYALTGKVLKPAKWKGTALTVLYKVLGKKRLYPLIAQGEYAADKNYLPLAERFPGVKSVMADEKRHGDAVMGLLGKEEGSSMKKVFYAVFLVSIGCWIGIHRNVIKSWITGSDMPQMPEWHKKFIHK